MFHKEGYKIIALTLIVTALGAVLIKTYVLLPWLKYLLFAGILIMAFFIFQFFRNPKRTSILDDVHILAPVDGKVVVIEEVFEKEFFNEKRLQISIFMSPINVHVTRYPASGKIIYSKYHPGKYLVAWHPKSSEENERTTVVIKTKNYDNIMYRQIAGAMARRIVNYAIVDQTVIQGEDCGFIKFGSRVDVFLPLGTKVNVALNEKVIGALTVIAG